MPFKPRFWAFVKQNNYIEFTTKGKYSIITPPRYRRALSTFAKGVGPLAANDVVNAGPAQQAGKVYVIIGGFGSSTNGYRSFCGEVRRETGCSTVYIPLLRWRGIRHERNPRYPNTLYRQAMHVTAELKRRRIKKAVLFGHSLGSVVAMIVAVTSPELVDHVVLFNPASMVLGFRKLGRRLLGKARMDAHNMRHGEQGVQAIIRQSRLGLLFYFSNLYRSLWEGIEVCSYRAFEMLYPRLQQCGVKVYLVCGEDDNVFLLGEVKAMAQKLGVELVAIAGVAHDVQFYPPQTLAVLRERGII